MKTKPLLVSYRNVSYALAGTTIFIVAFVFRIEKLLCILQLVSLLKMWYDNRKSQIMLIIDFFITLYSIPVFLHYFLNINLSAYQQYNNNEYFFITLVVHTLFLMIISCGTAPSKSAEGGVKIEKKELLKYSSSWKFYLMFACATICMMFGKTGQTIFERQGYGQTGALGTALYEYSCFFFLLAYIFSGNRKNKKKLLFVFLVIYCIKSLLYGNRVEVIQILIMAFILFLQNKLPTNFLFLCLVGGYLFMMLIGNFRSGLRFDFDSIKALLGYNTYMNRLVSNESDVWYSSTIVLNSIGSSAVTMVYRSVAALYFVLRLFIPSSLLNQTYNVVPYLQKNLTICGGGGLISAFLYFYFGTIGLIGGAILISSLFNRIIKKNQSMYWKIFLIQYLTMLPRWFAYSPEAILKTPIYAVLIFVILSKFRN